MQKNIINITEAAKEKKVARATIYEWMKRGMVNTEEIFGKRVIVKDDKFANLNPAKWSRAENTNWGKIYEHIKLEVEKNIKRQNQEKILLAINQMLPIKNALKRIGLKEAKVGTEFYDVVLKVDLYGQETELKRFVVGEYGFISMDNGSVVFYDHITKIEFSHFLSESKEKVTKSS